MERFIKLERFNEMMQCDVTRSFGMINVLVQKRKSLRYTHVGQVKDKPSRKNRFLLQ